MAYDIKYAESFNKGSAFVRDPKTGRFVLASEAAETEGAAPAQESAKAGEDNAPDTRVPQAHTRARRGSVVPFDETERAKKVKAGTKLAKLVEGKEFVPVKAEDIGVEAVDDYTLRFTLKQPDALLPRDSAAPVLPRPPREDGRALRRRVDAARQHRDQRPVHARRAHALQPDRRRQEPELLGRRARPARRDHLLPARRADDDDEPLQGGRGRRDLQPHRPRLLAQDRHSLRSRTTWTRPRSASQY